MAALVKILTADLRQTAEADDSEPLDAFLPRTLQVLPTLVDRHTERADRFALLTEPDLRRLAKEPDQNDFVYTLRVTGTIKWPQWPRYASNSSFVSGLQWNDAA
jgi:hypothetical protein